MMTLDPRLSKREWDVVEQLLLGKSNRLIALSLGISDRTVEFHLTNIYTKFHVCSRVELILTLRNTAGLMESDLPGNSTVEKLGEAAENGGRLGVWRTRASSFRAAVFPIGKELTMTKLWHSKHIRVGVLSAIFAGALWIFALISSATILPHEIFTWTLPMIIVWAVTGSTLGYTGERNSFSLRRVFFSALLGTGLSVFAIIPFMLKVVVPVGKLAEQFHLIDPSTMRGDVATALAIGVMLVIWLFGGLSLGNGLLFLTIKHPDQRYKSVADQRV